MSRPGRAALILLAALAVGAAGCESKKTREIKEFTQADKAIALPPPPMSFMQDTPDAKVRLTLPPGIDAYPELHRALYESGKQELVEFAVTAKEDRAHLAAKGHAEPQAYQRTVAWTVSAISPHLISLRSAWFADTGGAHPNHGSETHLWDRVHNLMLLQSDLYKPDYDFTALDGVLCDAVTRAKTARMGPTDPKGWECPKWADSRALLVPSGRPYRVGGVLFLFDPYVLGPYAEGDYEALIPLSAFHDALAQPWVEDFTGSPSPAVKPRP